MGKRSAHHQVLHNIYLDHPLNSNKDKSVLQVLPTRSQSQIAYKEDLCCIKSKCPLLTNWMTIDSISLPNSKVLGDFKRKSSLLSNLAKKDIKIVIFLLFLIRTNQNFCSSLHPSSPVKVLTTSMLKVRQLS